jgi:outer membrane protein assembly factor BamD (BamD/ComL family)
MQFYQNEARFRDDIARGGKWYFYNPTAISFGQNEFRRKWGDRKLEDHWRRRNKAEVNFDAMGEVNLEGVGIEGLEVQPGMVDNKSREYYLREIPLTDSMMTVSHERIQEALYRSGLIYREEFSDLGLAMASLEDLNERYPQNEYRLETYNQLYEMNDEMGKQVMAEYYKNKIVSDFPESEYARILSNPEYLEWATNLENSIESFYSETYQLYQEEKYAEVVLRYDEAKKKYSQHAIMPRMHYLKALSNGKLGGFEVMNTEMDAFIDTYPQHELVAHANEVKEAIRNFDPVIREKEEMIAAEELYNYLPDEEHLVVIYHTGSVSVRNQLAFNITDYNLENYLNSNLETRTQDLEEGSVLISINAFANAEAASLYLSETAASGPGWLEGIIPGERIVLVSVTNYRILLEDKSFDRYLKFYNSHYTE